MKARVRHIYEVISGFVLAMLGFSSCNEIINGVDEYGMPHATFTVIGTVTAADTDEPIDDIKVKYRRVVDPEYPTEIAFLSQNGGQVQETFTAWPDSENIEFTFEDIDGDANGGQFLPDTLRRKDLKVEFIEDKDSNWHKGDYVITFEKKLDKVILPDK